MMNETNVALVQTKKAGLQAAADSGGMHDFDFLVGQWTVRHRRLKHRLSNSREWEEFDGTMSASLLLGGQAIIDDNVLNLAEDPYRAATMRSYNPATKKWSIWWLDSRRPSELDPPLVGEFRNGVGTFFADDTDKGKPIRVRFIWSEITSQSARWEQAFSTDNGQTWEVNWVMVFIRARSQ